LSSILANNPKFKAHDDSNAHSNVIKNISNNLLKPLKHCLEQFEHLENKHQIISKLP
jgi:hypothetical protein